jgi:dTDP-4-amino-4,6-dideoxy-D-galactose acyltransferase
MDCSTIVNFEVIEKLNVYEMLDLDTEIFGFPVARILPDTLTPEALAEVLFFLGQKGVRLVFWASDPRDEASQRAARHSRGFLADQKVTYAIDLAGAPPFSTGKLWECAEYNADDCCEDLEALALQVGHHSRFGADPRMPVAGYEALYRLWIRNSVNRTVADAVLVAREDGRIVGMVTVGIKAGRGFIGLFAVAPGMRERHIGSCLLQSSQTWFRRQEIRFTQVVTQRNNIAACRLYEKGGYTVAKLEHFYHFWL